MPKGPNGEKRPASVFDAAFMVAKIATGEIEDIKSKASHKAQGGKSGGAARAKALTPEKRHAIAKKAAAARWKD